MKKIYKLKILLLLLIFVIHFQGCNILENYLLNLPLMQDITSTGNGPTISETESFCLEDYEAYSDNIDEIQNVEYVAALYRTLDVPELTPGLAGQNIIVTVEDGDGILIFTRILPTAVADDYIDTPYEIELTESEIALVNGYLAQYKENNNLCFIATITMDNITAGQGPPYTLTGEVELLVSLEIAP
jgi:hypothetical protein